MAAVEVERHEHTLLVRLNRPEAGNSLNGEAGQGLADAFAAAAEDTDVRAVVFTGAGERIFCAGMDLKAFARGEDTAPVMAGMEAMRLFPKPLVAAVNGHALGGGFELMMFCDLVVAARHATFGLPEVKRGLFPGGPGTRLPTRIPLAIALEMGLTGDAVDAERAASLGLVNRVVDAADLVDAALALAGRVAANGPLATRAVKRLMLAELGDQDRARVAEETRVVFSSEDAKEGASAFAEKRAPVWKGR